MGGFDGDKKKNLHAVWDSGIIDKIKEDNKYDDWTPYATSLANKVKGEWKDKATQWSSCLSSASPDVKKCLTEFAGESIDEACKDAYKDDKDAFVTANEVLDEQYYKRSAPIVDERLAAGGVRLAALMKYALKSGLLETSTEPLVV